MGNIEPEIKIVQHRKWYLVYPETLLSNIWISISLLLFVYVAIYLPYSLSFINNPIADIVEYYLNYLFYIDIFLSFFNCYNEGERVIDDWGKIIGNYLTGWFAIDFISSFPFSYVLSSQFVSLIRLTRIIKIFKIFRILKLSDRLKTNPYAKAFLNKLDINHKFNEFFWFMGIILLLTHITGCLWFYLTVFNENNNWLYNFFNGSTIGVGGMDLYVLSIYWAMTTIATVGFGDIYPTNNLERTFNIIWITVGVAFYSYTIGTLSTILSNANSQKSIISSRFSFLNEFAKERNIDNSLLEKMTINLEYLEENGTYVDVENTNLFLEDISLDLTYKIARHVHEELISKVILFANKDINFVAQIISFIKPKKVQEGQIIYQKQEYASFVYFLLSGNVGFLDDANKVFKVYLPGSYFGEIEIFKSCFRQSSTKALNNVQLLVLPREVFLYQMQCFPEIHDELLFIALQRDIINKKSAQFVKKIVNLNFNCLVDEAKRKQFNELQGKCHEMIINLKIKINKLVEEMFFKRRASDQLALLNTLKIQEEGKGMDSKMEMISMMNSSLQSEMNVDEIDVNSINAFEKRFEYLLKEMNNSKNGLSQLLKIIKKKKSLLRLNTVTQDEAIQVYPENLLNYKQDDKIVLNNINEIRTKNRKFSLGLNNFRKILKQNSENSIESSNNSIENQKNSLNKFKNSLDKIPSLTTQPEELSVSYFCDDERNFGSIDLEKSLGFLASYFKKVNIKRKEFESKEVTSKKSQGSVNQNNHMISQNKNPSSYRKDSN